MISTIIYHLSKVLEYDPAAVVADVRRTSGGVTGKVWLGYSCNYAIYSEVDEVSQDFPDTSITVTSNM